VKVAIVSSGLVGIPPTRGGAVEVYVYQLTRHLRALGMDAIAIDFTLNKRLEYEEHNGALIVKIPIKGFTGLPKGRILRECFFGFRVSRYLKELGIEITHANTAWAGFTLAKTLRNKVALIYTCHNGLWPEENVHTSEHVIRHVEGYTMRVSRAVIALNRIMARSIATKAYVDPHKIFIVPNGVDTDFFKPDMDASDVIERYGLEGSKVILFVGRVTYVKGVHLLVKAFKDLIEIYKDIKIVIAGPLSDVFGDGGVSTYASALISYAERNLPRNSYIFTGAVDRDTLKKLYSVAHVCVLPSYAEAFPMVLIEAMSCGCPVIASNAGGIPDVVKDGVVGFLFKKGDYMNLKEKLERLLSDEDLRKEMSLNARKHVEENYSWRAVAEKISHIYRFNYRRNAFEDGVYE